MSRRHKVHIERKLRHPERFIRPWCTRSSLLNLYSCGILKNEAEVGQQLTGVTIKLRRVSLGEYSKQDKGAKAVFDVYEAEYRIVASTSGSSVM